MNMRIGSEKRILFIIVLFFWGITANASGSSGGGMSGFAWEKDNTEHIFFTGINGHIYELKAMLGQDWNSILDLTEITNSPISAEAAPASYVWNGDNSVHVIYDGFVAKGGDLNYGHIGELFFKDGQWHSNDLTEPDVNAPIGAKASGYAWEEDNTQHVIYAGNNNHIIELMTRLGSGHWFVNDLTKSANAPPIGESFIHWTHGSITGYAWEEDNTQHVFYNSDGHIIELMTRSGSGHWFVNDLTESANAPKAHKVLGPLGYVFRKDGSQHVIYIGQDHHIYELSTKLGSGNWNTADLTSIAKPTPPLANPEDLAEPAGYAWEGDNSQHVIYVGEDSNLHELFNRIGSPDWYHNTIATDNSRTSSPWGYAWEGDNSQHVLYETEAGNLHELMTRLGYGNWQNRDLTSDYNLVELRY
jgi:hypothetical protein